MALIGGQETKTLEINVDATFTNLAEDLLVVGAPKPSVRLRVAVGSGAINDAVLSETACRFDLTGLQEGVHALSVSAADISLPKGVSLLAPLSALLTIRIEKKISRPLDVVAELDGEPASGFVVGAVRLKPERLKVTGTPAMLDALDTLKTRPIDLKGVSESFKREVPLALPETVIAEPSSRVVIVEIDIQQRQITRVLKSIPIAVTGKADGYRIEPEGITLTIDGPETTVSAIESNPAFSVTIDLTGLPPGSHFLKASIKLPLDTTLIGVTPELFSVIVGR